MNDKKEHKNKCIKSQFKILIIKFLIEILCKLCSLEEKINGSTYSHTEERELINDGYDFIKGIEDYEKQS